jgi:predicted metal-dependent peptidase
MPRKEARNRKDERLERTRARIWGARGRLERSILGPLLEHVTVGECEGKEGEPQIAAVDPAAGTVWLNPHHRGELGEPEWTFILAHQLLHLGLNHAARREHRDPLLWNVACDHAADNLLHAFKLGRAPHDFAVDTTLAGRREEEIYDQLAAERRASARFHTFAGVGRCDLLRAAPTAAAPQVAPARYAWRYGARRTDWENLFGEGIRQAVDEAVEDAARVLGETNLRPRGWRPAENARRWVMNEFPLLGALASQLRIIADADLCQRMDISIAAVNGFLGEVYFHPGWQMSQDELTFIYVHELLHVALLHHQRGRGRDPWLWNVSADFVINGWLVEMGVGKLPQVGALYDPRLQGMSTEEVYDLLAADPRRCRGLRGFRGKLGDILLEDRHRRIYRGDVTTLDDVYRRCMSAGLSCPGRGLVPAGLLEEIRGLFAPPVPWDVELGRWMEQHVPVVRDPLRTYARASRRQSSTPDIPRPARYVPQEWLDACTFGVVLDTSGSMDRELLGRALGAIASYAEARDVPAVRLVLCDAAPYDRGFVLPGDLRGLYPVKGRGGTALQPAINFLLTRPDLPPAAPLMILTDGWCEEELVVPRPHCFVLPRKQWKEGAGSLRTTAPVFRILKEERYEDDD